MFQNGEQDPPKPWKINGDKLLRLLLFPDASSLTNVVAADALALGSSQAIHKHFFQ